MIAFILTVLAFLFSFTASANERPISLQEMQARMLAAAQQEQAESLQLNLGMWSTNRSFCGLSGTQCVSITNVSYSECVVAGFREGDGALAKGNMVFLMGGSKQASVWVEDGPDPDVYYDLKSCIPPRVTVYGPVPSDWTEVHLDSDKYFVGDRRDNTGHIALSLEDISYELSFPNPVDPSTPLTAMVFGQNYAGDGQPLLTRHTTGNTRNMNDLRRDISFVIGG